MKTRRPTFGAFNQGGVPTIACFNKATTALGVNFDALIVAMQAFVDQQVVPVWGTPAKLIKSTGFVKGAWAMVFLDNADQPGALAYHDLTPDGLSESKVFVKTTVDAIIRGARSGQIGDGKIFILPLEECIRIRTGESGMEAIG